MIIECKKKLADYEPVNGNEEKIINHLLKHDYYNNWRVEKDDTAFYLNINNKTFITNAEFSFFKCDPNGKINYINDKHDFIEYIAVPYNIGDKDILKIFQARNFVSLEKKIDDTADSLFEYWILKTTTETFVITSNGIIIFDTNWEIVDCLVNDQNHEYGSILESNQYIVERDD